MNFLLQFDGFQIKSIYTNRMPRLEIRSLPTLPKLDFHHCYTIYEVALEELPA